MEGSAPAQSWGWIVSTSVLLLTCSGGVTVAQTGQPAGTLQVPAKPPHEQPAKPPAASPHTWPIASPARRRPPNRRWFRRMAQLIRTSPPEKRPRHPKPHRRSRPRLARSLARPHPRRRRNCPIRKSPRARRTKLPRFASLRSDDVNMRAGPGTRYRIDWVYKRRDLPVEIEREFDVWRWVRDADGIQGWVHQATLMGRRNFIVQKGDATLRSEANDAASAVAVSQARGDRAHPVLRGCVRLVQRADRILSGLSAARSILGPASRRGNQPLIAGKRLRTTFQRNLTVFHGEIAECDAELLPRCLF